MRSHMLRTLIITAATLTLATSCNHAAGTNPPSGTGISSQDGVPAVALEILADVNKERGARGLPALNWNSQLSTVAAEWNQNMYNTGVFQHRNLNLLFNDSAFGHYGGLGENIFKGSGASFTSGAIHVAWMRSDGHRKNVLSPGFDSVGIAVLCIGGTTWATQNFGREMNSSLPAIGTGGTPPADPITVSSSSGSTC